MDQVRFRIRQNSTLPEGEVVQVKSTPPSGVFSRGQSDPPAAAQPEQYARTQLSLLSFPGQWCSASGGPLAISSIDDDCADDAFLHVQSKTCDSPSSVHSATPPPSLQPCVKASTHAFTSASSQTYFSASVVRLSGAGVEHAVIAMKNAITTTNEIR